MSETTDISMGSASTIGSSIVGGLEDSLSEMRDTSSGLSAGCNVSDSRDRGIGLFPGSSRAEVSCVTSIEIISLDIFSREGTEVFSSLSVVVGVAANGCFDALSACSRASGSGFSTGRRLSSGSPYKSSVTCASSSCKKERLGCI